MNSLSKQLLARGSSVLKENIFAQTIAHQEKVELVRTLLVPWLALLLQVVCGEQDSILRAGCNLQRGLRVMREM